jgi:hypothetical protein
MDYQRVDEQQVTRSQWIEQYAARFASISFVREFVFPNPQYTKKQLQKEACDLVIARRDRALVVQMKSQDDPAARDPAKLPGWIEKNARDAAQQLGGSLRTLNAAPFWCIHPRRGRVNFAPGEITTPYGLVLIDCGTASVQLPADLPLSAHSVAVHYFDTNDFLNVVMQLRSFHDIQRYLAARAALPDDVRRRIGGEKIILEHYVLHDASFADWMTYEDAARAAAAEREDRDRVFYEKQARDKDAVFVEYIADTLATRLPNYQDGLDAETRAHFDADENRQRYLVMQDVLADLSLVARRQLGRGLFETFGPPIKHGKKKLVYRALYLDELPDFAFVALSTEGYDRQQVINCALALLGGALAHFGYSDGMVIVDRDCDGFEIALVRGYVPTEADVRMGKERFGALRMEHRGEGLI